MRFPSQVSSDLSLRSKTRQRKTILLKNLRMLILVKNPETVNSLNFQKILLKILWNFWLVKFCFVNCLPLKHIGLSISNSQGTRKLIWNSEGLKQKEDRTINLFFKENTRNYIQIPPILCCFCTLILTSCFITNDSFSSYNDGHVLWFKSERRHCIAP